MPAVCKVRCRSYRLSAPARSIVRSSRPQQPLRIIRTHFSTSNHVAALDSITSTQAHSHQVNPSWTDAIEVVKSNQRELQHLIDLREDRQQLLKKLANSPVKSPDSSTSTAKENRKRIPPEPNAGPISTVLFRRRLRDCRVCYEKAMRAVLAAQLLRCTTVQNMLVILVIAMTDPRPEVGVMLSTLSTQIFRAWYRCRDTTTDKSILRSILQYIARFEMAKIPVSLGYYCIAVKFAARCRDVDIMRRCLRRYRAKSAHMHNHCFRAVIAKLSIGRRGLGAIRNGVWQTNHLRQVLLGFEAERHLPEDKRCHLEIFLDRKSWNFAHPWIAALGLAKATDRIWEEWRAWKQHPHSKQPKRLVTTQPGMNSKIRGDWLFIEQMQIAGDNESAWKIFRESGLGFVTRKYWVVAELIRDAHLAGDMASKLQLHLIETYGDEVLPSGQMLRSLCTLDVVDNAGHAVMSKASGVAIHQHLRTILDWTISAAESSETRALHAAETSDVVVVDEDAK